MRVLDTRNVNRLYAYAARWLIMNGDLKETRNGGAMVARDPVATVYERPQERVLFEPKRDANPFFHFMEGLWILAGRDDVEWLSRFNGRMAGFSDDGVRFHGAYGYRLRKHFGFDQLDRAVEMLRANPEDRRVVLSIWDPRVDLGANSKDIPCNDAIKLRITSRRLDMMVFNRSNDFIWGTYGANVVQFSMLLEYLAARIGVKVGQYWQISTDYHGYTSTFAKHTPHEVLDDFADPYSTGEVTFDPLVNDPDTFDHEVRWFVENAHTPGLYRMPHLTNSSLSHTAYPMYRAYMLRGTDPRTALEYAQAIRASDWRKACLEWLARRGVE